MAAWQSGVPQGSVLGLHFFFFLYLDEFHKIIQHSNIKLFADDITLYKENVSPNDHKLLQDDLPKIYEWYKKWLLKLNPLKCDSFCISCKHHVAISGWPTDSAKVSSQVLRIFINCQLKWGDHVKHLAAKTSCSLNYLHHTLYSCTASTKATAYKAVRRQTNSRVCFSSLVLTFCKRCQHRAARWVYSSRWNTVSHN